MPGSRPAWTVPIAGLAALALALAAAACGDDDSGGDEAGTTTTEQQATSSTTSSTSASSTASTTTAPAGNPDTTEGAIARFEQYLHALGAGDLGTVCEIAAPAAQQAADQGFGDCETTFGAVLGMISPEQSAALRSATVDPAAVDTSTPGEVYVPVDAVRASVTFTESDLGSYRLAYQDGDWFIID